MSVIKKSKNFKTLLVILLILSIIPLVLFLDRETQAEMNFPVEAVINASPRLNIRKEANTKISPIGSINYGEEVLLLEQVSGEIINGDNRWYRIDYNNQDGYVSAQYVTIQSWQPELPPTPQDQEFERYLEEQGFPISYRHYLHQLHNKYPKWQFKALNINSDFDSMLNNQYRPEGSINYVATSYPDGFKSKASKDFDKETNTWVQYEPVGWLQVKRGYCLLHGST